MAILRWEWWKSTSSRCTLSMLPPQLQPWPFQVSLVGISLDEDSFVSKEQHSFQLFFAFQSSCTTLCRYFKVWSALGNSLVEFSSLSHFLFLLLWGWSINVWPDSLTIAIYCCSRIFYHIIAHLLRCSDGRHLNRWHTTSLPKVWLKELVIKSLTFSF